MDFLKKQWTNLVILVCLMGIIIYLVMVNAQIKALQHQNAKIISTFDSIESVTISTDSGINEMAKQIDKIENNVTYIVKKVRRR